MIVLLIVFSGGATAGNFLIFGCRLQFCSNNLHFSSGKHSIYMKSWHNHEKTLPYSLLRNQDKTAIKRWTETCFAVAYARVCGRNWHEYKIEARC